MHVLTNKLRKEVKEIQTQNSTMFVVEMSEVTKDYQTQEKVYTNYKAKLFAKTPQHIDYMRKVLAVGSVVTISSEKLVPDIYTGGNEPRVTMIMDNPRLISSYQLDGGQPQQNGFNNQQPRQNQAPQQQQGWGNQNQQSFSNNPPQHGYNEPPMDFDDDIPL